MDLMQFLLKSQQVFLGRDKLIFELIWKDTEARIAKTVLICRIKSEELLYTKLSFPIRHQQRMALGGVES